MKNKYWILITISFFYQFTFAQEKVGINVVPQSELDVRTTSNSDGADINIGNADNSHFLRLFSGKSDLLFSNPTIYWSAQDSLVFGTFGNQFTELARLNSDGDFLMREGGIAMGMDSTDGFMEILVDSSYVEDFVDQMSSGSPTEISLSPGARVGQSFTVGIEGGLKFITLPNVTKSNSSPTFLRMNIYEGNSPGGNIVGSDTKEVPCEMVFLCPSGPNIEFKFPGIPMLIGQEYFIEIEHASGANVNVNVAFTGSYPGGTAWSYQSSWSQQVGIDVLFFTEVGVSNSTKVPFFKLTNEGENSRIQIKDYFLPIKNGDAGQVMVSSGSGQLQWQNKEDSDWDISGNTVYTLNKSVGIGKDNPETKLHLVSADENNGTIAAIKIESPGSGNDPDELMLIDGNEIDAYGGEADGDNDMLLLQNNSDGDVNMVLGGGNVGVGKESVGGAKLYIHTDVSFEPNLTLSKDGGELNLDNNTIWAEDPLGGYEPLDIQAYGELILSRHNGVVGIGTAYVPTDYKLAVRGKIVTEEILVQNFTDWPDYVFQNDYDLMKIPALKKFILDNNHLPDVPSENEVYKNGVELGEMQKILLRKIEELTLYIIEQDDRIKLLEKQIKKQ